MKQLLCILFLFVAPQLFAHLSMEVENKEITRDEAFHLVLKTDKSTNKRPDFSPLEKDFIVAGTEQSSQYTIINGKTLTSTEWILLLLPKHAGKLTIPSIQLGQEKTNPVTVSVGETKPHHAPLASHPGHAVMMKTEASNEHPYVHQEVIYTVKIYHRERLIDASYQPSTPKDGLMIPLGNGRRYQTFENGEMYIVDEQKYAFFPDKSGKMEIESPEFRAVVYHDIPEQISLKAKPVLLNIKKIPKSVTADNWIPAKNLTLREIDDGDTSRLTEGQTFTRTFVLTAEDLPAALLPPPPLESTDKIAVYAEPSQEKNSLKNETLTGKKTIKVTYLFNQAGDIVLPEIRYPWFNTVTGKEEIATVKERVLTVLPSRVVTKQNLNHSSSKEAKVIFEADETSYFTLPWILVFLFAIAWSFTLWMLYRTKRKPKVFKPTELKKTSTISLKKACEINDPKAAKEALFEWAKKEWPGDTFLTLDEISQKTEHQLKEAISNLTKTLYDSSKENHWDGKAFWNAISSFQPTKKTRKKKKISTLVALHPE